GVTARLKIALQKILAESTGRLSGRVWQFVVGIAKLKVAGAERRAFTQWGSDYARQAQQNSSILGYSNFITVFKATFSPATSLLLFLIVACLTSMPAIGDFIAFNAAFMQFMAGISGIVGSLGSSIGVTAVYERARPILETVPETDAARLPPESIRGFVEVS